MKTSQHLPTTTSHLFEFFFEDLGCDSEWFKYFGNTIANAACSNMITVVARKM